MAKDITLFKKENSLFFTSVKTKEEALNTEADGVILSGKEGDIRKIVDSLKEKKLIMVVAQDDSFNRRIVETMKINYLVGLENNFEKDGLKQRDSGINHVVAKLARNKKIAFVVDLTSLMQLNKDEKIKRIAKIIQNIKICRKTDCPIKFASFAKDEKETLSEKFLQSFGFSIGMSSQQTKQASEF